jgi:hypothetical protein
VNKYNYERNKNYVERNAIKIIKNNEERNLIAEVTDNPHPSLSIKGKDYFNYLNYKTCEYVITFYDIKKNKNPLVHYLKIALNMMNRYLKHIEEYNEDYIKNNPDILVLFEGSIPNFDVLVRCKLYKIPPNINEYVLSDREHRNIKIGEETIYDPDTENKIISNIEYYYLMQENIKLTDTKFSPQITIGIAPMEIINVAIKLVNAPMNQSFIKGSDLIESEIVAKSLAEEDVEKRVELSDFNKNILIYLFYCSSMIFEKMLYDSSNYIFKYAVNFLIRHKMSDFKIFRNVDFINFIINAYKKKISEITEFDEMTIFYYLILLIAKDAYYVGMDYDSLSDYFKEESELLNNFLKNELSSPSLSESVTKLNLIYSTWNDLLSKQYPYIETEEHEMPLLFEVRFFNIDIYNAGYNSGVLEIEKPRALTVGQMLDIVSKVEEIIETSDTVRMERPIEIVTSYKVRTKRPIENKNSENVEQIFPLNKKKLRVSGSVPDGTSLPDPVFR